MFTQWDEHMSYRRHRVPPLQRTQGRGNHSRVIGEETKTEDRANRLAEKPFPEQEVLPQRLKAVGIERLDRSGEPLRHPKASKPGLACPY